MAEPQVIESTALSVVEPQSSALVLPQVDAAGMRRAMTAYTEICSAVLEASDHQTIQQKRFKKKSAWQKLAVAFGVSTAITDHTLHHDAEGRLVSAEFTVRATAPNGRYADGWGSCSVSERRSDKPGHDIPATAETRARNRACSNLFAFGEVSAEEVAHPGDKERVQRQFDPQAPPSRPAAEPSADSTPPAPKARTSGNTITIKRDEAGKLRELVLRRAMEIKRAQAEKDGAQVTETRLKVAAAESIAKVFEKPLADMTMDDLTASAEKLADFLTSMGREVPS